MNLHTIFKSTLLVGVVFMTWKVFLYVVVH